MLFLRQSQGEINSDGVLEWENSEISGYEMEKTSDGGYIILGEHGVSGKAGDILFIQTDKEGYHQNQVTYGGSDNDGARQMIQTSDGGYIILGNSGSSIWLIKTDSNGNEEWNQTFGGSDWDYGYSIQQTTDGGYIITGVTRSFGNGGNDVWLIKTDSEGNTVSID